MVIKFYKQTKYFIIITQSQKIDMFKKPFKVSAQNQLSGKDRKTMRNKLAESYDQVCLDKIFNANDKIVSCKTSGSKMIIYNGNDYPLFVDGTGKNDYFPSLYVAMAYEPLIKVVDLNEGVESYIYNGANLMWPGVRDLSGLEQFQKDQVVGIRSAKGELIAIGALGCSAKQLKANADKSGVAVYILHYFNDKLWQSGPKTKPQILIAAQKPKKQEKKQQIVEQKKQAQVKKQQQKKQEPQQKKEKKKNQKQKQKQQVKQSTKDKKGEKEKKRQSSQQKQQKGRKEKNQKNKKKQSSQQKQQKKKQQSEKQSSDEADFANLVHTKQPKPHHAKVQKIQKKQQPQKVFSDDQQQQKKGKKKPAKKQTKKKAGKKQSDNEEQNEEVQQKKQEEQQPKSAVSTKLMDQQFKQAFLNVLKLSKVEGEFPIDSGRFFIDFMLLARPQGIKLQIKDTSYKKLGKFYQQMAKQKFIQFKHSKDKKGQQGSTITKILWDNEQLKNYQPTIQKMNEKQVQQKQEQANDGKKKGAVKLKLTQTLQVQTAYKLHQNFKNAVFAKRINYTPTEQQEAQMKKQQQQVKNQPEFYTQTQVKALIERYINEKVTVKKDKKQQKQKKQDKEKKVDKMIVVDYKNNKYLAQLLKRQIEQYQQNIEAEKEPGSEQQQQNKKPKKKRQNVMKIDRGSLVNRILKTCSTSYHLRDKQTGLESFNEGVFKGIQLVAQKSNNKNITKIIGLQLFIVPREEAEQQINIFVNKLKQKFACSVNTQNLPGKNAGKQIIVHGNFISQLQDMFTQQYKINEDYITSQNKLDKKKKR